MYLQKPRNNFTLRIAMSLPKHLPNGIGDDSNRIAVAPYNFVELPDKVVEVKQEDLPPRDCYHRDLITGRIDCTLTTASPLYIRCGLKPAEFKLGKKAKDSPEFFYTDPDKLVPVIPGSSLRGMLRSLIEIITYSKIPQVSDQTRFFFRDVAGNPKQDSLAQEYKRQIKQETIKAGYLLQKHGKWYIRPAKLIEHKARKLPYVWVKEQKVLDAIPEFISVNRPNYRPQYFVNVSFGDIDGNQRYFAGRISTQSSQDMIFGTLVSTGNMLESSDGRAQSPRKNHCLIGVPNEQEDLLEISEIAIEHYRKSLTDFQKEPPFSEEWGVLAQGRCVFYCDPQPNKLVTLFGQSPNFRIPYSYKRNGEAASAVDFIPEHFRSPNVLDQAEAMFGFVRADQKEAPSLATRVFVSDATCNQPATEEIWLAGNPKQSIIPRILSTPKPTTFQNYLVQTSQHRADLKHYASQPKTETVIRGHKLYWHQGKSLQIEHPDPQDASDTQLTRIKPIKAGVSFKFTIRFENLTDPELGALLWILNLSQRIAEDGESYRLSLGMGKPLGMGAAKVEPKLYCSDRRTRYTKLFEESGWKLAESETPVEFYISKFEDYMLAELGAVGQFTEINRIQSLLTMLSWQDSIRQGERNQRRYMEIERSVWENHKIGRPAKSSDTTQNEYRERPVLPTPLQVVGKFQREEFLPLSEKQIEARRAAQKQNFAEGQVVDVKVISVKGIEITCQFPGGIKRKVKDKKQSLQPDQVVKVQITEIGDDKAPRKFKFI
jgi:CRISPR-associated protein (TIGR03986 family)